MHGATGTKRHRVEEVPAGTAVRAAAALDVLDGAGYFPDVSPGEYAVGVHDIPQPDDFLQPCLTHADGGGHHNELHGLGLTNTAADASPIRRPADLDDDQHATEHAPCDNGHRAAPGGALQPDNMPNDAGPSNRSIHFQSPLLGVLVHDDGLIDQDDVVDMAPEDLDELRNDVDVDQDIFHHTQHDVGVQGHEHIAHHVHHVQPLAEADAAAAPQQQPQQQLPHHQHAPQLPPPVRPGLHAHYEFPEPLVDEPIEHIGQGNPDKPHTFAWHRKHIDDPVHIGTTLTLAEMLYMLFEWKVEYDVGRNCFDQLLCFLQKHGFPEGNYLPRSWYMFKRLVDMDDMQRYLYHVCSKDHCIYPQVPRNQWNSPAVLAQQCPVCDEFRMEQGRHPSQTRPAKVRDCNLMLCHVAYVCKLGVRKVYKNRHTY